MCVIVLCPWSAVKSQWDVACRAPGIEPPLEWILGDIGVLIAQLTSLPFPTVVCYQSNRDELRRRIIQWLEAEIVPDGWFSKGSNYSETLDKYFKVIQSWGQRLFSPRQRETSSPVAWSHLPIIPWSYDSCFLTSLISGIPAREPLGSKAHVYGQVLSPYPVCIPPPSTS